MEVTSAGQTKLVALLMGLPKDMSEPVVDRDKKLQIFIADSEPIEADITTLSGSRLPNVSYPALVEIRENGLQAIGRDAFRAYGGFPAYAMRIRKLVPTTDGAWLAYDQASGQLMRLKVESE